MRFEFCHVRPEQLIARSKFDIARFGLRITRPKFIERCGQDSIAGRGLFNRREDSCKRVFNGRVP